MLTITGINHEYAAKGYYTQQAFAKLADREHPLPSFFSAPLEYIKVLRTRARISEHLKVRTAQKKADEDDAKEWLHGVSKRQPSTGVPSFLEESEKTFKLSSKDIPEESVLMHNLSMGPNTSRFVTYEDFITSLGGSAVPKTALMGVKTQNDRRTIFMSTDCRLQQRAALAQIAKHASLDECFWVLDVAHAAGFGDIKTYVGAKLLRSGELSNPQRQRVLGSFGFADSIACKRTLRKADRHVMLKKSGAKIEAYHEQNRLEQNNTEQVTVKVSKSKPLLNLTNDDQQTEKPRVALSIVPRTNSFGETSKTA